MRVASKKICIGKLAHGEPVRFEVGDDLTGTRLQSATIRMTTEQYLTPRYRDWLKFEIVGRMQRGGKLTLEIAT